MLGFIVTSLQNTHPPASRVATSALVMNTPSESLLADFVSGWNCAHAAPLPAAPPPVAASPLAQIVSQFLLFLLVEFLLGVWKPLAAPPPAAYVSAHAEPKEELEEIYAHASAEERRQMRDEKAQAKLRVHLTPRQSHGRVSNSLGMDGWANASLDELRQMDDENALFHKAFYQKDSEWTWKTRPEAREDIRQLRALWLNYDFKQWSKARPEVRAHIRRIRARNSQRDE